MYCVIIKNKYDEINPHQFTVKAIRQGMLIMDQSLTSFIDIAADSDFTLHNLPYGIFSETPEGLRRVGVALGDWVIDLTVLEQHQLLDLPIATQYFSQSSLNAFIAAGATTWSGVRRALQYLFSSERSVLQQDKALLKQVLLPRSALYLHLPIEVAGYTDFYSSKEHATNVGSMFRDPKHALLANWSELPVGYNGRASSVVVSGTDIVRPSGQIKLVDQQRPIFSASKKLDFELETAFIVAKNTQLGQPVPIDQAWEHIFGMVLLNDWSARDIQQWEYVPLGPFNAKTFASAISPWVVTLEALEPFRTAGPVQDPEPLDYLKEDHRHNSFDINLSVKLLPAGGDQADVICQTNFKHMYWSMAQQLTHHTIAGCNLQVGDLMGSGTISGATVDAYGSLLELTWNNSKPLQLSNGQSRGFIEDGDSIIMQAYAEKDGIRVGFGEVRNQVLAAIDFNFPVK